MASKFFTWTKGDRRHAADAYQSYRVDGLMPVDQYPLDQHWEAKADLSLSRKRKVSLPVSSVPARAACIKSA